ncbi:hypothetical protein ABZ357_28520 [Streptomyces sp. NPDC005917]|uniref:hypothetical protein n=1 Tax=unclassified Streptomyces TaxID=2593676 RepID=UPI0033FD52DA
MIRVPGPLQGTRISGVACPSAAGLAYQVAVDGPDGSRTVVVDARTGTVRSNTPDNDEFLSPKVL